jgi:hypothetical protein
MVRFVWKVRFCGCGKLLGHNTVRSHLGLLLSEKCFQIFEPVSDFFVSFGPEMARREIMARAKTRR